MMAEAAAPFVWGAGGAQMTPDRIAAERKLAATLMQQGMDYSPVQSWTQGVSRVAQAMLGGYDARQADKAEAANAAADKELISKWMGGGTAPAVPVAPAAPSAPVRAPAPVVMGEGGNLALADPQGVYGADAVMMPPASPVVAQNGAVPRGIRNNNPLNIEAGGFTQSQPGFAGSDGRFARFESPEQGVSAASKLLDTYQSKYGLNTINGIVNRWAPSTDGNNVSAYAANVARQMGLAPDAKLNLSDPTVKTSLIRAMGQHENGMPINGASDPAALPPNSTPAEGFAIPGQAAPVAAPSGVAGLNPGMIAALTSPYTSEGTKKVAQILLQHQMQGDSVTTVDLGNSVGVMDKRGNIIKTLPKGEPNKGPEFGVIGKDQFGEEKYGWKNPRDQSVTPYTASGVTSAPATITGPDGKPIEVPAGNDPKKFRDHITTLNADIAGGKKTEVQAKSEKFGNKMELAERNLSRLDPDLKVPTDEAQGPKWVARGLEYVPGVGNAVQSKGYQQYRQARDNFITALLRDESGAAIGSSEFNRYEKELFPQPGDSKEVITQKREARRIATDAMKKAAGPGYKSPIFDEPAAPAGNKTKSGIAWSVE